MSPIEVQLSGAYTLVLERAVIGGRWPALSVRMRNLGHDGEFRIRGGFKVAARQIRDVIEALEKAERQMGPRSVP